MTVTIKSRHVVEPAEPTWSGIFPLTELDQSGFWAHLSSVYIYPKPTKTCQNSSSLGSRAILQTMKDSLSRILVPYYPLAGRLRWVGDGGRAELVCNAKGAVVIEAESSKKISDFGDFLTIDKTLFQGLNPHVNYNLPLHELPILFVQLTWFKCGGFVVGITVAHMIADAQATFYFLNAWANLSRNNMQPNTPLSPYLDRRDLLDDDDNNNNNNNNNVHQGIDTEVDSFFRLPKLIGAENDIEERQKEVISKAFVLSERQISCLMKMAGEENQDHLLKKERQWSRFEVICAHVWRCACKARSHNINQKTAMCFLIDSRGLLNPPLPPSYLGDAVVMPVVSRRAGELISMPLGEVCGLIREKKMEAMSDNYIRSTIKFLKAQKTLFKYQERGAFGETRGLFFGNPNLIVSSLLNYSLRGIDFGWGKEIFAGTTTAYDGEIVLYPGFVNDGSVTISAALQVHHMIKFSNYLYSDIDDREGQHTGCSTRKSTPITSRY